MADVQKEHGYTPIANGIFENMIRLPLNGTQFKIIMLVWRECYGFNRTKCELSDSYIASRLGIQRQHVQREIKGLFNANILTIVREPTFTAPRLLAFQKDFEKWTLTKDCTGIGLDASTTIGCEACNSIAGNGLHAVPGNGLDASTGIGLGAYRKTPLKTPLNKPIDDLFETIWLKYPRKEGKGTVSAAQKKKLYTIGIDEMTRTIERYRTKIEAEHTAPKYIKQGGTFFNSGYVDYLDENYTDSAVRKKQDFSDPGRYEGQTW